MCGTIDHGHTFDEYLVLHAKSGVIIPEVEVSLPIFFFFCSSTYFL
jgi:hypothetical protein